MIEQVKAGAGVPVGVGEGVGAAFDGKSIQLPSVKPH